MVTGGAGFIGSHLVERLLQQGASVVVVDDCSTGRLCNLDGVANHPRLRIIEGRLSEVIDLHRIIARCDAVFHLAAAVGVDLVVDNPLRLIATNIGELDVVLGAAAASSVPVIFTSTSEVYGRRSCELFREDDDLMVGRPHLSRWSYASSKLMGEFMAHAYAAERELPVVIARLFNTVGPRQTGTYGMVLPRFINAALDGEPLRVFGDGTQRRTFCAVDDTVEALIRLWHAPGTIGNVFNIGGPEDIAIVDLACLVIDTLNSRSTLEFVPYEQAYGSGFEDLPHGRPALDRLCAATGFRPATTLQTIIQRAAAAEVEARLLL